MNTVQTLIDLKAEEYQDRDFLILPEIDQSLSYQVLQKQVNEIDITLAKLGLKQNEKVAILMNNGLWSTLLFLGIMYSGRVTVPLNGVSGNDQLKYVIEHSDAKVIFYSSEYGEKYAKVLGQIPDHILLIETCPDTGPKWPSLPASQARTNTPKNPDDPALLIYTSGTTGRPKGVILTHKAVIAGGKNTALAHNLTPIDRALCVLPLYHINAEMVTVMGPLVSGGSVVMPHKFSVQEFWPLIDQCRCSWFSVVPTIIAYLLEQAERLQLPDDKNKARPQLRFGRSASSALSPDMHRKFEQQFAVPIVETMGLTETAAQILSNPMPPARPKYGSPGIAIGNQAKIIDEFGKDQITGQSGELLIRGENVMKEYYKNPKASAAAFNADGWLYTGDLAFQDSEGYFFVTGRLKEIIIKGGENIAPREIDEALYQHQAVLEAAAFALPDAHYGQEIYASVTLKPGADCSALELKEFCAEKIGHFKTPKNILLQDDLPKGPSGKIQRLKLADSALAAIEKLAG